MKEILINTPFKLLHQISLPKKIFEGKKIYEIGVEVQFKCPVCHINNSLIIDSDSGSLLDELYLQKKLITKDEILKNNIAKESPKIYKYLGELMIFQNLSALYFFSKCNNCGAKFFTVFSFGESQPSRDVCYISGVWLIDEINMV